MTSVNFQGLVLAGSRDAVDPVAQSAGLCAKALVPVAGQPMLLRVISALEQSQSVDDIHVVGLPVEVAERSDLLDDLHARHVSLLDGRATPSLSVAASMSSLEDGPVLVTTADHALLRKEIVDTFAARAGATTADIVIGLVRYELVQAVCPETRRTVMHFRGGDYCGCNLFLLRTPAGRDAVGFWTRIERRRKQPARIAWALGPMTLLRFFLRRLTLEDAFARLSRLSGARITAVELPFGEAAIDVDKPEDLEVAEVLAARY